MAFGRVLQLDQNLAKNPRHRALLDFLRETYEKNEAKVIIKDRFSEKFHAFACFSFLLNNLT